MYLQNDGKNPGHVIVISKQCMENIYNIQDGLLNDVYKAVKEISTAIRETYACNGISMRQHNEPYMAFSYPCFSEICK